MQLACRKQIPKSKISFHFSFKSLQVQIETERLYIHSYRDNDFENCLSLYGDQEITKYFDYGKPLSRDEVNQLILEKGHKYFAKGEPYGLFSIFNKEDMSFIGQFDLMPIGEPGVVEIGCILHNQSQNQGFCTEIIKTFINDYIEELNYRNFKCNGLSIIKVIATAHPKNNASNKIVKKIGMAFEKFEKRFGNPRLWYSYILPTQVVKNQIIGLG